MAKNVFICDDDDGIVDVTSIVLGDKGYNITAVTNCDDIFNKIKAAKPDVILLDLWMPDITGEEIAKTLKADKTMKHIPIIIVSASKDTEKVAKNAGADAFICKPFDIDDLEKTVETQIKNKK